jgi:hypothetical protein
MIPINDDVGRIWKETVVVYLRYYTEIFLQGLRKTMKNIIKHIQCSGRDVNQTSLKYHYTGTTMQATNRAKCYVISTFSPRSASSVSAKKKSHIETLPVKIINHTTSGEL